MTKDELLKAIDEFYYVGVENFMVIPEKVLEIEKETDEERHGLCVAGWLYEMNILSKLCNIHIYNSKESEFYKQRYKDIVTGKHKGYKADESGIIENYGMLVTDEEFEVYKEVYDEIFLVKE